MVLIDTSVWIDFLAGRDTPEVGGLLAMLEGEESIAFTGMILQELLQGCPDERAAKEIENHFEPFLEIFPGRSTYKLAAQIFRDCRRKGFAIRSSVDCLIAACAMEQGCAVHHKDRDFVFIKTVCGLKVWQM